MGKIHGLKGSKWVIRKKEDSIKSKSGIMEKILNNLDYIRDKIFQRVHQYKKWVPKNEDEIFEEWKRIEGVGIFDRFETR